MALSTKRRSLSPHSGDPVAVLLCRLRDAGINRSYVERVLLPKGWLREATFDDVVKILSERLSIEESDLRDNDAELEPPDMPVEMKRDRGTLRDQVAWAAVMSIHAARLAVEAVPGDAIQSPCSAKNIRDEILSKGAGWVGFKELIDWCWGRSIPVLHISHFPARTRKMDGLAGKVDGRPVVVLSKNARYAAWQIFILAHELGHIFLGHLDKNEPFRADVKVRHDDKQDKEQEANEFAAELLMGSSEIRYMWRGASPTASRVAKAARESGEKMKIYPGSIIMNYAWAQDFFPIANAALKELYPDEDAPEMVHKAFNDHIQEGALKDADRRFLKEITS